MADTTLPLIGPKSGMNLGADASPFVLNSPSVKEGDILGESILGNFHSSLPQSTHFMPNSRSVFIQLSKVSEFFLKIQEKEFKVKNKVEPAAPKPIDIEMRSKFGGFYSFYYKNPFITSFSYQNLLPLHLYGPVAFSQHFCSH